MASDLAVLGLESEFSMAVVQTAYANGASTAYLKTVEGLKMDFAKTGVKFVHHVADHYDIGIYFEANGHGTVLIKGPVVLRLRAELDAAVAAKNGAKTAAATRLLATHQLVNQAVGDAISDALFIEAILTVRGWGLAEWDGLYEDLPSRQSKLPVQDRAVVQCSADETKALAPDGLQVALDGLMGAVAAGRAFVRPSGTEDVVRVYAEAATQAEADALAHGAAMAVYEQAGGVGDAPKPYA